MELNGLENHKKNSSFGLRPTILWVRGKIVKNCGQGTLVTFLRLLPLAWDFCGSVTPNSDFHGLMEKKYKNVIRVPWLHFFMVIPPTRDIVRPDLILDIVGQVLAWRWVFLQMMGFLEYGILWPIWIYRTLLGWNLLNEPFGYPNSSTN